MRVKEIRELSDEEINGKIADARKEIVQLRFELAGRKLRDTASLGNAKKRLARLLTIQKERELGLKR
jgi:large subunit ribosomal protein L29